MFKKYGMYKKITEKYLKIQFLYFANEEIQNKTEWEKIFKTPFIYFEFSLSVFSHSHWYFKISKSFLSLFSLFFIHTLRKTLHSIVNPWRTVKALDVAFRTWWTTHKRKYFICIYFFKKSSISRKKIKNIYIFVISRDLSRSIKQPVRRSVMLPLCKWMVMKTLPTNTLRLHRPLKKILSKKFHISFFGGHIPKIPPKNQQQPNFDLTCFYVLILNYYY